MTTEATEWQCTACGALLSADMETMTTTEQSVEDCLKELQFMFPESPTHEIIIARGKTAPGVTRYTAAAGALAIWSGNTLTECMDQVRAWHAEQGKES